MESNTGSVAPRPGGLKPLTAAIDGMAAEDLHALPTDGAAARVLALRGLLERLEGQWLRELAAVDARGAAGAEAGTQAPSTAAWLRGRLRAGRATASGWVRMARALFRGPLPGTARALAAGELSASHAAVLVTHQAGHHRIPADDGGLVARLQTAVALLPPALGGAPTQPLEVGRTTRVVSAAQRAALAVRDGGCAFPGCDRPPPWCDAHHVRHWLHGGATDLANLALLCRAHHRAVHEGGWHLQRHPNGDLTATPPQRRQPTAA
jgi:hypothetical protein